jgi:hypothetical protein
MRVNQEDKVRGNYWKVRGSIVKLLTRYETLSIVEHSATVSQGDLRVVVRINYRRDGKYVQSEREEIVKCHKL